MNLGDTVSIVCGVAAFATLPVRLRVRLHRPWDIGAAVLGLIGVAASVARNVEADTGWPETVLVAVLFALLPFALVSVLILLNLGFGWYLEQSVERSIARHGVDDERTRRLSSLRDTADNSWRAWMGPR